jgi:hypothetical protein
MAAQMVDLPTPPFEDAKETIMKGTKQEIGRANAQLHFCAFARLAKSTT